MHGFVLVRLLFGYHVFTLPAFSLSLFLFAPQRSCEDEIVLRCITAFSWDGHGVYGAWVMAFPCPSQDAHDITIVLYFVVKGGGDGVAWVGCWYDMQCYRSVVQLVFWVWSVILYVFDSIALLTEHSQGVVSIQDSLPQSGSI